MVEAQTSEMLRWIPLLPLAGALFHGVILGLIRRESPRLLVIGISCGAVLLSFCVSVMAFIELVGLPEGQRALGDNLFTWIGAGSFSAEFAFRFDPLSAVMCLVVTGVGSLIHIYSIGYMDDDHRDDKGFQRFFCYLNLFTCAMLLLVLGDNMLLLFLGWEGVGVCSYLLIGFWYSDRWNAYCGSKAFIVNRIGDFGFLIGLFLLFWAAASVGTPTIEFTKLQSVIGELAAMTIVVPFFGECALLNVVGLCLFVGAAGKSAQIPLYVWLPDAMAGPTPVSALIHAATMVTAGVYMVCRFNFLYGEAPIAAAVIAWTGALTALFAATIAIAQTDIKKVLAYSTVSQLGYMFMAAGCGSYTAAVFHLGTHAFFKALLFLGSGAVILAMHHEQDMDKMGGLRRKIPRTHMVFLIGVLAISGVPYFSGFFSKDEVLLSAYLAHDTPGHYWLYGIGLLTAGLTAFYMFRLHFRIFFGECRATPEVQSHIHEPSWVVIGPLFVLAFFSIFGGLFGPSEAWVFVEDANSLANFLTPMLQHVIPHDVSHGLERGLGAVAVGTATLGFLLAFLFYVRKPGIPAAIASKLSGAHETLKNKYYVDEIYDSAIVRPLVALSDKVLFQKIDAGLIDGLAINGSANSVRNLAGRGLKHLQTGMTQSYIFFMIVGTIAIVGYLLR